MVIVSCRGWQSKVKFNQVFYKKNWGTMQVSAQFPSWIAFLGGTLSEPYFPIMHCKGCVIETNSKEFPKSVKVKVRDVEHLRKFVHHETLPILLFCGQDDHKLCGISEHHGRWIDLLSSRNLMEKVAKYPIFCIPIASLGTNFNIFLPTIAAKRLDIINPFWPAVLPSFIRVSQI